MNSKDTFQIKGYPLIKFQTEDIIKDLQRGHLYAKTLEYYRERERSTGDSEIGDSFEAMLHINEGYVRINGGEPQPLKDALIRTEYQDDYVFCMFAIYPNVQSFSFSDYQKEKMKSFGDTALIINDSEEFIKRVTSAAQKAGLTVHFGPVKYTDLSEDNANLIVSLLNGMWNIAFWKREMYRHQQEARFFFITSDHSSDHIDLDIGDISDISIICTAESVLNGFAEKAGSDGLNGNTGN